MTQEAAGTGSGGRSRQAWLLRRSPSSTLSRGAGQSHPAERPGLGGQLVSVFLARTFLNIGYRIVYPFLPAIARGLNTSVAVASSLITLRMAAGLLAPLVGPIADRLGRRRSMEVGLALAAIAGLLLATFGSLAAAAAAFFLYGLAKVLFDPSVYAYLGDAVPYSRRGRAVGLVEFSWSIAWLVGVPATGLLIQRYGWRAPWVGLVTLAIASLALLRLRLPPDPLAPPVKAATAVADILRTWRRLATRPGVVQVLGACTLLLFAIEVPFIVYGAWLESSFGLSLSTLGVASVVVGLSEAVAELGTALVTDRLGKRRSVLLGLLSMAASLTILPALTGSGLAAALVGLILVVMSFEFSIVSLLPLITELVPEGRAAMLSLNITVLSLGRLLGGTVGGWLWHENHGGMAVHALIGAGAALLSALLLSRARLAMER